MQCQFAPAVTHPARGLCFADRANAQPHNHNRPYAGAHADAARLDAHP
jgi:hypothetical protein